MPTIIREKSAYGKPGCPGGRKIRSKGRGRGMGIGGGRGPIGRMARRRRGNAANQEW
jgi:hypothetical protein